MRALEPEVANAVWEAVEALIPSREDNHPMGGHRPRIPTVSACWESSSGW